MSTWNLGIGDVSEETRAFKDKLASKDGQIAAQQDRIAKQAAEYEELNDRFNEAMHKLSTETQRALQLETTLQQRTDELRNEQIASDNAKSALHASLEKNKATLLELRQMETTLERISNTSDNHHARCLKLEREKSCLEHRVKELESNPNHQHATPSFAITPGRRVVARPRSSSLSNFRITTLEQELSDSKILLTTKEAELQTAMQKLSKVQEDLLKGDNDRVASERKWSAEVEALKSSLQELEEELMYLREQQGDGSREDELLKRIEEDDAKIAALELMLRGADDVQPLKDKLRHLEIRLKEEEHRVSASEERQIELVRHKEDALEELEINRRELHRVVKELRERKARDQALQQKAAKTLEECDDPLMNDTSCLINMDSLEPQTLPATVSIKQPETDEETITHIERLLSAIERLRGERDSLRRDVQFLESESRFAIEALEAKLSASMSTASNNATLATIDQLRAEMDDMHAQMIVVGEQYQNNIQGKHAEIKRLGLHVEGLAIALGHLESQSEDGSFDKMRDAPTSDDCQSRIDASIIEHAITRSDLERLINERDQLLHELQIKEAHWEQQVDAARMGDHEARERLDDAMCEISELNDHLEELESERDSLALQLTNLMSDLQVAQEELGNAETRYTNLQFHQLNTMTSNEATRTLREHIEELENRVMRRTEQIGIHQHDIRRLETNLRLQEERLIEMTSELETVLAQKDAMVEDCADAREARDEALARVEAMEVDLENAENLSNENSALVTALIAVIADTVSRARLTIREKGIKAAEVEHDLSTRDGQHAAMRQELDEKITSLKNLTSQFDEQHTTLEKVHLAFSQQERDLADLSDRAEKLQEEKLNLESQVASLQIRNSELNALQHTKGFVDQEASQQSKHAEDNDTVESSHVQLKLQHAEALGALQGRLVEADTALEELQTRYNASAENHQRAANEARASIQDLEAHLGSTTKALSELQELHARVVKQEREHEEKIAELEDRLAQSQQALEEAVQTSQALEIEIKDVSEELERLQQDRVNQISGVRAEYDTVQQELEKKVLSLQGRFEEETRLLAISKEEIARLNTRLSEETASRAEDQKAHTLALVSVEERANLAEQNASQLEEELVTLKDNLQVVQTQLAASEDEKSRLQEDLTTHEAEVQKSKSLCRYLETQIKDSDGLTATLKADLERLRADLARSEKICKTAEVNLSLQTAQHKRETAEFQRELSALRIRLNVEQALADLEERNNEMEELLRAKCAEIEENDDRVLEMLKEKKKLSTKVESLNRKVQNLQAKLAAAKASSNAIPSPSGAGAGHKSPSAADSAPVAQSIPPSLALITQTPQSVSSAFSRPRSATTSFAPQAAPSSSMTPPSLKRKPSERVVSGPSQIARPKTPERSRAITPQAVFKARTPEQRVAPAIESMSSAVVIGKKRSAPDDFEACENVPAQAFTADGEDVENKTPRVRRVLNSLQSGFTPLRHQTSRPTAPMPSPRRTAPPRTSPFISDMTNTPDTISAMPTSTTKQSGSKRSWLGKIRGSSQTTDRPPTSRSLFDRGESS